MTRRSFLKTLAVLGLQSCIAMNDAVAAIPPLRNLCTGRIAFYNLHTHEGRTVRYLNNGGNFSSNGLAELNHLFRCHYTGQEHIIDPKLFVLLDAMRSKLGATDRVYRLVSGYRSPAYNTWLRENGHHVAKRSYHLRGMAADIRMDGVSLRDIHRVAKNFRAGGVGSYSDFIHVDVGPVRYW